MQEDRSNRYDFQGKSNRFMEFISREMMRNKNHKSHVQQPKQKTNSRLFTNNSKVKTNTNNITEIYSQPQIPRQRRGASVLKSSSKSRYTNQSSSKLKKDIKDSSLNFYQGLKAVSYKQKQKTDEHTPRTQVMGSLMGSLRQVQIQQLHYQMVKMNQNVKKLQKQT